MDTISESQRVSGTKVEGHNQHRTLKILEVASAFPGWGGTEIHILNLAEELIKRGHAVDVTCRPGRFVEAEAVKRGLHTIEATCKRQNSFQPLMRYLSIIRRGEYDVVHVHWDNDYKIPAIAARLCGVPVVLLSHHSPYPFRRPLNRWLYRKILFNRLIALSESVRRLLFTQGVSAEKAVTIHHGIDTQATRDAYSRDVQCRQQWDVPEEATLVGMIGRIGPEKGVHTFVRAIAKLKEENVYGVFVGEGKSETEVRKLAEELGITDRIKFAGFRLDVSNAISALDIHVLASVWAEPCAAVIEQAMALSKPVIGTDIGGTPEIIKGEVTGILVPPGDETALANAIKRLADDPELRRKMGAAGRQRVDSLFTQDVMVDKIEGLYLSQYEAVLDARQKKRS